MNRDRIMKIACLLATTLLVVACTNDAYTDGNGTSLPEGMYPLTFTATQANMQASPQTRVSDYDETGGSHKSQWTDGDKINVIIGNNPEIGTYTLNADGSIKTADQPVYWQTATPQTVNAWYSNITGQSTITSSTVSLADQSNGLAYVLKATAPKATFNTPAQLEFQHQLAKVRVKLEKRIYEGALSDATVEMEGYTSCTVSNGAVTADGTPGYIAMHKATYGSDTYYEANVVPGTTLKDNAFKISADGKTTTANLTSEITLTAANVHTITLAIDNKKLTEITSGTITEQGDYIMTGNISEEVTLNGDNISLILYNVTSSKGIQIKSGTPTIQIKGTNNSLTEVGIVLATSNANVVIQGDGSNSSKLTIRNANTVGIGVQEEGVICGNITIKDVDVDVEVEPLSGAAAIGGSYATRGFGNGCGDILIENSVVRAKGGKGASAIGFGLIADGYKIGMITIKDSKIYVTTVCRSNGDYGACIGFGSLADNTSGKGSQELGLVTITTTTESKEVFFGEDRFKAIDRTGKEVTTGFYKVGKSTNADVQKWQSWSGLKFNETMLASGDDSGYGYK